MRYLRFFLLLAGLSALLLSFPAFAAGEPPAPVKRLLVNNDGTNLFWRKDLTLDMVKRRAAECPDAVTTYLLCPNGIQKMMYPGEVEELSTRGALPDLVKAGEDPFGLFLSELKTRKMEVFITFRMNEVHNVDKKDPDLSKFWHAHPDWRVEPGAPLGNWMAQCLDYSHPEVQDRAVAQICELLEKYRPDGIELDWMRFPRHLSGDAEKVWSNRGMLSDVVAAIRLKADELAGRLGRPVRVAVRIPSSMAGCRALGVDLADWTQRKLVDFVTAAPFLASDFSMPIGEMRSAMGDNKVPIYGCIEFGYSAKSHSEATLHAAALGLYESGVDGIYLFNFPCWRETQDAPPWSWVPQLKDPVLLACGTLEFPLINGTNRVPNIDLPAPLPVTLQPGESRTLALTLPGTVVAEKPGLRVGHTPPAPPVAGPPPSRGDLKQASSQALNVNPSSVSPGEPAAHEAHPENGPVPPSLLVPPGGGCRVAAGGVRPTTARFTCVPSEGVEAKLNGEPPSTTAVRPGENTVELRNTGREAVTVTEARLSIELPAVPPTVFPELKADHGIHVAPEGSDKNPGTLEKPLQSLNCAINAVSDYKNPTIWMHAGTYKYEGTGAFQCPFEPGHDTPREDILYLRAWPGDKVVFDKGVSVKGWKPIENGLWEAPSQLYVGQLHVNEVRAHRARGAFPEGAELWGDTDHIDGVAGYRLPDDSMTHWKNTDAMCLGYFTSWAHMTCPVAGIKKDGDGHAILLMSQPSFYLGLHKEGVQIGNPAYIENALELLDEPGEWQQDSKTQTLYYLPREGEDMATAEIVAGGGPFLFRRVSHIWFEGITFANGAGNTDASNHMDMQANFTILSSRGEGVFERDGRLAIIHNEYFQRSANLNFFHAKDCRFTKCTFTRLGGAGVNIDAGSQGIIFDKCLFEDIGENAIQIGGVCQEDHHPSSPDSIVRDNIIANCTIRNCGTEFEGSVGIFVGYANGTVISHNEIYDLPYSGISAGWGWGEEDAGGGAYPIPYIYATPTPAGANRIEYNHIHHVMQRRDDGGGVYTLGNQPGTVIRGNHIHDNGEGPGGIYLDEGSGFIEITGNSVYNVKIPMNYNNRAQDRKDTCFEHDNAFGVAPGERGFPEDTAKAAGPERP